MRRGETQNFGTKPQIYNELGGNKTMEVDDIEKMTGDQLEQLKAGDMVIKRTMDGETALYHTYIVSHKQATGICMTYSACGYLETISYDKIEGVWTFNSKDVWQAESEE